MANLITDKSDAPITAERSQLLADNRLLTSMVTAMQAEIQMLKQRVEGLDAFPANASSLDDTAKTVQAICHAVLSDHETRLAHLEHAQAHTAVQTSQLEERMSGLESRVGALEYVTRKHEHTHKVTSELLSDVEMALIDLKKDEDVLPPAFIEAIENRQDLTNKQKQTLYSYIIQYYREISKYLFASYIAESGIFEIQPDSSKTDALMMLFHGVGSFAIDSIGGALAPFTVGISAILLPLIGNWALDQALGKYEGLSQELQQVKLRADLFHACQKQNVSMFSKSPHHVIHTVSQLMALASLNQLQDLIKNMSVAEIQKFVGTTTKLVKKDLRRGNMPFTTPASALVRKSSKTRIQKHSESTRSLLRHSQVAYPDPITGEEIICRLYVGDTP